MSVRGFKLRWALIAERRVLTPRIVETLDVVKYISSRFVSSRIILAARPLGFHTREEALHRRVVPAIPASAHAAFDAMSLQVILKILTRVLTALVRMVEQTLWLPTAPQCQYTSENFQNHLKAHGIE